MVVIERAKLVAVAAAAAKLASINSTEPELHRRLLTVTPDRGWQPSYVLDELIGSTCRYNGLNLDNPYADPYSNVKDVRDRTCGKLGFNFWQEAAPGSGNYVSALIAPLPEDASNLNAYTECDRGTAGTGPENQLLALGGVGFVGTDGAKSIRLLARAVSNAPDGSTARYIKPQETLHELAYPTARSACGTSDTLFPTPVPTPPATPVTPPGGGPTPAPSKRVCSKHNLYRLFYKKNGRLDVEASIAYVKQIYSQKAFSKSTRDQMISVLRCDKSDRAKVEQLEQLAVKGGCKVYKHEDSFKVCWSVPI